MNQGKGAAIRKAIRCSDRRHRHRAGRRPRVRPGRLSAAAPADPRRTRPTRASARASSAAPHRVLYFWHSVGNSLLTLLSQHVHEPEPHRHGDLLQGDPRRAARSLASQLTSNRFGFEPEITAQIAQRATRASTRCRSATPAAPTRKARRSAGGTASPPSGTSHDSICSADALAARGRWSPASIALAVVASWVGVVNGFTYDDATSSRRTPLMHSLANWWRLFGSRTGRRSGAATDTARSRCSRSSSSGRLAHDEPMDVPRREHRAVRASLPCSCSSSRERVLPLVGGRGSRPALFAVHPVHVEAVANVVGQAELLVAHLLIPAVTTLHQRPQWRTV